MTVQPFPRRSNRMTTGLAACARRQPPLLEHCASSTAAEEMFQELEEMLEQGRGAEYVQSDPAAATHAVSGAVDLYDARPFEAEPANPWPRNRALLDFAILQFKIAGT